MFKYIFTLPKVPLLPYCKNKKTKECLILDKKIDLFD